MRIVLLSDIHSNLEALLSVEKKIRKISPDKVICLGDIVGYAAKSCECIDIVKGNQWKAIAGNHEYGCLAKKELSFFNPYAQEAILWTKDKLKAEHHIFLGNLALTYKESNFICVHSSLFEPEEFHYLDNYSYVFRDFQILEELNLNISFVAHTHIPAVFIYKAGSLYRDYSKEVELKSKYRYIINIGSIGQPRDRDPRSCLCIFEEDKRIVKFERVGYNIKKTQEEIIKAGLPSILAQRLKGGW